jgi:hypothetical protein
MSFTQWMSQVDRKVMGVAGLSVHDLTDQPFREWWEEGMSPKEAAELTLEDNDFYDF